MKSDEPSASPVDVTLALVLLMALILSALAVDDLMSRILIAERPQYSERHYHTEILRQDPLAWIEFSSLKGNMLLDDLPVEIETDGFIEKDAAYRFVGFGISTVDTGYLDIRFPPQAPARLAIYLTDGENLGRVVHLSVDRTYRIESHLEYGRWVYLPIPEQARQAGRVRLTVRALANDAVVSALALLPPIGS